MSKNTDFQKAIELINESKNILITTHTKPDGDSCGCIAAISEALTPLGKKVTPLFLSPVPEWYKFLFAGKLPILGKDISSQQLIEGKCDNFDLIIIVDANTYSQLTELEQYLKGADKPILVIDHHITSDGIGSVELIDTTAAATGLIVFDFFKYAKYPITKKIAEALFVATATDTGWFQFNNTDSRVHRSCAELIEAGVDSAQIYHLLYQNFSSQRVKLLTKMFNTLELHFNGRYATQNLLQVDFKQTGTTLEDTENLIDECRRIRTVEAAALFVELPDGKIKCSLRSRGAVNVGLIAQKFGGGGHKMAAGANLPGPIEKAKQLVYEQIDQQLNKTAT